METAVFCSHTNCGSQTHVTCSCAPSPLLLCQEHVLNHIGGIDGLEDMYLSLQPLEQEAFLSAQALLLDIERIRKEEMKTAHSHRIGNLLKELSEARMRSL